VIKWCARLDYATVQNIIDGDGCQWGESRGRGVLTRDPSTQGRKVYPIRDSVRLIEEFMLLTNYLVAQRLITQARGRALLRNHIPPIEQGVEQVVDVSNESFDFDIDTTDSSALQESLSLSCSASHSRSRRLCVRWNTWRRRGLDESDWAYYTQITSSVHRYPYVIVHRATLDKEVDEFLLTQKDIHLTVLH